MKKSLFQVNLKGVLKILSDSLYSRKEVFIRELLQNSVDSLNAAKNAGVTSEPFIQVEFYSNESGSGLVITDNGIGLTMEEVEEFLAKVGSSSKSVGTLIEQRDSDYIGQFGIGLLSCFMVSNEIIVYTRSIKTDYTIRWVGYIDGSYYSEVVNEPMDHGLRVVLKIDSEHQLTEQRFLQLVNLYGKYLNVPIGIEINGNHHSILNSQLPWLSGNGNNDKVLQFAKEHFDENFNNLIELHDKSHGTKGVAFILSRPTHHSYVQANRIYIKNMFVTDKAGFLLPDWAFFVKAVVNSTNLSPTASREDIYENEICNTVKEELGDCIKRYLVSLSNTAPKYFAEILTIHGNAMKSLALANEDFLKFIYPAFKFPTTLGELSLKEVKAMSDTVLFISDLDGFRQIAPIAKANSKLVVNAAYVYDTDLLFAISDIDSACMYVQINSEYFGNILKDVSIETNDYYTHRLQALQQYLQRFECNLLIKQFDPANIPSILYIPGNKYKQKDINEIREESNDLWSGISENVFFDNTQYESSLYININNPLITKLLNTVSKNEKLFIETIYINSMLYGHYPLSEAERECANNNLLTLLENNL